MRIERLDLLAFGPFTDLSLPLGAPGVHIVYGPNEAGKSTALRALHDLFYKIPKQTPYDFVHDKPDMKLRAVVRSDDGRVVEFVRHKRDKNSLTDPRGNPLDESVVQRLLGGVSSSTFLSMFALTLEELERGGESLLEGGGDVGEALLSARAYPQLRALVERLRKQRDALFRPQGRRGPTINKELGEYQDLNRRIGEAQLRIADYRRRLAAVAEQRQREKDLDQKLASLREEQKRWTALQQALPALHTRAQQMRRIAELEAEGPLAPLDFADRLPRLEEQSRAAEETLADSTAELAAKQEELDRLVVDARLLDAAPEVERLARSRERIEADEERLAALERQAARLREEAREILQEVRPDPAGADGPAVPAVDQATRNRVRELADAYADLLPRVEEARGEVAQQRRRHTAEQERLDALPDPGDSAALAAALDALPATLFDEMTAAADTVHETAAALERIARDAGWDPADCAALAAAHAPLRDQVVAYRRRADEHAQTQRRADEECAQVRAELTRERLRLAELTQDETVPTEEALAEARRQRDALWQRVRDGSDAEAADAYERAVRDADELADRALAGAQRIAERQQARQQITVLEHRLALAEREAAAARAAGEELAAQWQALWPDPLLPAPDVDAAETVLDRLAELRRRQEEHTAACRKLADRRERAAAHADQLRRALRDAGAEVPEAAEDADVEAVVRELRERAAAERARREQAAQERADQERTVQEAKRSLVEAEAKLDAVTERLRAWEEEWRTVAASVPVSGDRLPKEVLHDLDQCAEAASRLAEADQRAAEAEELREQIAAFHDRVGAVLEACGLPVPDSAAQRHAALDALRHRVAENSAQEQRRQALSEEVEALRGKARSAQARLEAVEAECAQMCQETGVDSVAELRAAIDRAQQVRELRHDVALVERSLAESWPGGVAEAEQAAAGVDREELAGRLAELGQEIAAAEEEHRAAVRDLAEAERELGEADGSALAAQAAQEREEVLARIAQNAETHTRLVLAHTLLLRCIEEYRQAHQGPLLRRAEELFRQLTVGRFRELQTETADDGTTVLRVRRATGKLVDMGALSEGTRHQLYLALRLATVEHYAAEHQSMPFVLDDVFMTFDDERAAAGLRVLESVADRVQPVVLTHHAHLAELARDVLPEDRVHVHRLPRFTHAERVTV